MLDLQVFASPRITLKPLVPSFPCFANIYVSLMEKVCDILAYLLSLSCSSGVLLLFYVFCFSCGLVGGELRNIQC